MIAHGKMSMCTTGLRYVKVFKLMAFQLTNSRSSCAFHAKIPTTQQARNAATLKFPLTLPSLFSAAKQRKRTSLYPSTACPTPSNRVSHESAAVLMLHYPTFLLLTHWNMCLKLALQSQPAQATLIWTERWPNRSSQGLLKLICQAMPLFKDRYIC